jgi:hypothetical protein
MRRAITSSRTSKRMGITRTAGGRCGTSSHALDA